MSNLHSRLPFKRKVIMRRRMIRRGLANLARNMWLTMAACLVMSITLFTVFVSLAATVALNGTVETVRKDKSDLSVFLKPETEEGIVESLQYELEGDANVDSVAVTTSDEQSDIFKDRTDDGTLAIVDEVGLNMEEYLPIRLSIRVYDLDDIESVKDIVMADFYMAYMDTNAYEKQFYNSDNTASIEKINEWAFYAQVGGAVLGGVFLFISVLVIFNTIRMAIFARKEEIEIEKLIGAEKKYIRGPFLVEAELYGVIAGGLALTMGYLMLWQVMPYMKDAGISVELLENMAFEQWYLVVLVTVMAGVIISELSARLAIRRYLRI